MRPTGPPNPAAYAPGVTSLPRSTPSAQGVAAGGVLAFLDVLDRHGGVDPHSVLIVRHGAVVAEGWWAPYSPDRVHLLYSVSKTFTATAVGFAVAEGLLALDDPIADHFPEFRDELPAASRAIRIRDALAMATGHGQDMLEPAVRTDPAEPVRGFLLHAPDAEPGTRFAYNQPATYAVAAVLQRRAGTDLVSYLRPRLLDPLGAPPLSWQEHPPGRAIGFSGLHATTETLAALGQLHLADGMWQGRRVLPAGWAAEVRAVRVGTPDADGPDWRRGYGFQVWQSRHGYRADGAFGQLILILSEQDAVIALTMATESVQDVLDAVWEHLVPAMGTSAARDGEAELANRLAGLLLPPSSGAARPDGAPPVEYAGAGLTASRSPDEVVRLADGQGHLVVPAPSDGWTVIDADPAASAVAVSGGWAGSTRRIDIAFLESPHRLVVDLLPDGTIASRWNVTPLADGPSLDKRAPRPLR